MLRPFDYIKGKSPLHDACYDRDAERLAALLAGGRHKVNELQDVVTGDPAHFTALMVAGRVDDLRGAELLISHGAFPGQKNSIGATALNYAAIDGFIKMTGLLLDHGADVDNEDDQGGTALTYAVLTDKPDFTSLLLERGADPNHRCGSGGWTPLHVACVRRGGSGFSPPSADDAPRASLRVAEILLDHGADADTEDGKGYTTLTHAARSCMPDFVRLLLERGADPNHRSSGWGGRTPLHAACLAPDHDGSSSSASIKVAEILLRHGVDVDAEDDDGKTALLHAAFTDKQEAVRLLLEHGANPNHKSSGVGGRTPLQFLAENSPRGLRRASDSVVMRMAELLLDHGADVDAEDDRGITALVHAASAKRPGAVRLLLDHGANHRHRSSGWAGRNPLHAACVAPDHDGSSSGASIKVAEILLRHGVDVDAEDDYGETALLQAAFTDKPKAVSLLLEHGADPNLRSSRAGGRTPLQFLVENSTGVKRRASDSVVMKMAELLLDHGADVHAEDDRGNTALIQAAFSVSPEAVRLMLERGSDPRHTSRGWGGRTPLHAACLAADHDGSGSRASIKVAEILLRHGVRVDAEDDDGETALIQAAERGKPDIVTLLLEHGADAKHRCSRCSSGRRTALHAACRVGDITAILLLIKAGADPSPLDGVGSSPLSAAAGAGKEEAVRYLISTVGIFACGGSEEGRAAAREAAKSGHADVLRTLPMFFILPHSGAVVAAVNNGHYECAKLLMRQLGEQRCGSVLIDVMNEFICKNMYRAIRWLFEEVPDELRVWVMGWTCSEATLTMDLDSASVKRDVKRDKRVVKATKFALLRAPAALSVSWAWICSYPHEKTPERPPAKPPVFGPAPRPVAWRRGSRGSVLGALSRRDWLGVLVA